MSAGTSSYTLYTVVSEYVIIYWSFTPDQKYLLFCPLFATADCVVCLWVFSQSGQAVILDASDFILSERLLSDWRNSNMSLCLAHSLLKFGVKHVVSCSSLHRPPAASEGRGGDGRRDGDLRVRAFVRRHRGAVVPRRTEDGGQRQGESPQLNIMETVSNLYCLVLKTRFSYNKQKMICVGN